ncbi:MAG: hypothetical protein RMJ17_00075 [Candidatus Aenigmarchaeota archaeon]|nr:hypothetical protein [Candidatus Aenigmarchaeota archaeon]MDW8148988.1 hypothetical protein [Candidatus Aenigmarchaeota archaeon]
MMEAIFIAFIAVTSVLFSEFIFRRFGNIEKIKQMKKTLNDLGNSKKTEDKLKSLEIYSEYFKLISKPLIISSWVSIFFFVLILVFFSKVEITKFPFSIPIIGERLTGIWFYIILTISISLILKRLGYSRYL